MRRLRDRFLRELAEGKSQKNYRKVAEGEEISNLGWEVIQCQGGENRQKPLSKMRPPVKRTNAREYE